MRIPGDLCGSSWGVVSALSLLKPRARALGFRWGGYIYIYTYTPKVCRIIAFWATFKCFGQLFYLLLGSRYIH